MNLQHVYATLYSFLVSNPLIAGGIGAILLLLLWKKPAVFLKIVLFTLASSAVLYICILMTGAMGFGVDKKHEITTEREAKLSVEQ
ncbi:MAG: hypothetical protein ACWGOX_06525 [Desulforhopalus sp.]